MEVPRRHPVAARPLTGHPPFAQGETSLPPAPACSLAVATLPLANLCSSCWKERTIAAKGEGAPCPLRGGVEFEGWEVRPGDQLRGRSKRGRIRGKLGCGMAKMWYNVLGSSYGAHSIPDKGKPVVRPGRKVVGLPGGKAARLPKG
jgi:hypothetical protein